MNNRRALLLHYTGVVTVANVHAHAQRHVLERGRRARAAADCTSGLYRHERAMSPTCPCSVRLRLPAVLASHRADVRVKTNESRANRTRDCAPRWLLSGSLSPITRLSDASSSMCSSESKFQMLRPFKELLINYLPG